MCSEAGRLRDRRDWRYVAQKAGRTEGGWDVPEDAVVWTLEPHTAAKHAILRSYLGGWYPKLGSTRGRVLFLDGFAGPGIYRGGELGSPLVALDSLLGHTFYPRLGNCEFVYLFNEKQPDRVASLRQQEELYRQRRGGSYPSNVKVHIQEKSFDELIDDLLTSMDTSERSLAPTFAFIDPFGYKGISMGKLARLLKTAACEIFIYFDFNSVMRFATAGIVDDHFTEFFGTEEYKNAPPAGDTSRATFLRELYERQLRDVGGFTYVQSFQMINKKGKTGNYMSFGSRHLAGLALMKRAMWGVAPSGDYSFSDRLAGQDILLGLEPDLAPLRIALLDRYRGEAVSIEEIERFVLTETPFHDGHLRRKTLGPMQREGLLRTNQLRKGSFKDGTVVSFAT